MCPHVRPDDRVLYVGGSADAFFRACPNTHPLTTVLPHAMPPTGGKPQGGPFAVVVFDRFVEFLADCDVRTWVGLLSGLLAQDGKLLLAVCELPIDPYMFIDWSYLGAHVNLARLANPAESAAMFESPLLVRRQTQRVGQTWNFILQHNDAAGAPMPKDFASHSAR
jgi:hypothetical protein